MWEYALPMARRAYFHGSLPPDEIAARKLARLIHEKGWRAFRAGDVLRLERWESRPGRSCARRFSSSKTRQSSPGARRAAAAGRPSPE